jgi:hypothetical protein
MGHNLSKIFMDYGDSNWTVGVLIGLLIIIVGANLWGIGVANYIKSGFDIQGIQTISGMITIIVGVLIVILPIIGCTCDNEQNIQTAIRREYEDASFIKKDNKFTSNNITYGYDIKDRKIVVYPLVDNKSIKIIE